MQTINTPASSELFSACLAAITQALKPHISGMLMRVSTNGKSAKVRLRVNGSCLSVVLAIVQDRNLSTLSESEFFGTPLE